MTAKLDLFAAAPAEMKDWMTATPRDQRQPRAVAGEARRNPRLAAQRLRQLHQHAHHRGAGAGRDRAAHLPALRLARGALLHRPRARRAGLDRCPDPAFAGAHPRGGLRCARGALHRGGAGEAHPGDQRHQRLEPARGRLRRLARAAGGGGRRRDAGAAEHRRRGGELRPAASAAHPRRLPHARLGRRRRGRGAGGVHPLAWAPTAARCASPRRSCAAR